MKQTIGVFAHVDAGKTTFSESVLYLAKQIDKAGRVDSQNTIFDHNSMEKKRGMTIFSDIASFSWGDKVFQLIDTPGHTDFSAEMEQAISVLDVAILLIDGTAGIQSHTLTLDRLLKKNNIPTYLFINKLDLQTAELNKTFEMMKQQLRPNVYLVQVVSDLLTSQYLEWLCNYDDQLLAAYFAETVTNKLILSVTKRLIRDGTISIVGMGSALHHQGVEGFLDIISATISEVTLTEQAFSGIVYQVMFDGKDNRVTFIKCLNGELHKKDEIRVGDTVEKIHEIRLYTGKKYQLLESAKPGDIVGVTGLTCKVGTGLGKQEQTFQPTLVPLLRARLLLNDAPIHQVLACLKKIENQMPSLQVEYEALIQQISVRIMGKIQLEILQTIFAEIYQLNIEFGQARVIYKETIRKPVMGYGHFEPLRHYAEIHFKMLPSDRDELTFTSEVSTDQLGQQAQNIIASSLKARIQKGILTGSPLTKVHFILTMGAMHLEYSSKGDTREAAWRAIRQGLEKAESVLLEPWYTFTITVPTENMGRVLADIMRLFGRAEPPEIFSELTIIKGVGPVKTFIDYQEKIISFTKGKGAITLEYLDYLECHNATEVIAEIGYEKDRDLDYTSSSVFLSGPAGFEVKWDKVEEHLHYL